MSMQSLGCWLFRLVGKILSSDSHVTVFYVLQIQNAVLNHKCNWPNSNIILMLYLDFKTTETSRGTLNTHTQSYRYTSLVLETFKGSLKK